MTLTTPPPNEFHTLSQPDPDAVHRSRRLLPVIGYIALLLLLLYLLYHTDGQPKPKKHMAPKAPQAGEILLLLPQMVWELGRQ